VVNIYDNFFEILLLKLADAVPGRSEMTFYV